MKYRAKVIIKLKDNVKDSRGEAISAVIKRIGLEDNAELRLGKFFDFKIMANCMDEAHEKLQNIIDTVLLNPVVETYEILEFNESGEI